MKKKWILKISMMGILAIAVLLFQNCGQYETHSNSESSASSEDNPLIYEVDKRPLLSCAITNQDGRVFRRVSNISNSDETFATISAGEQITFDCSASMDYRGTYNITNYSLNFGNGFINSATGIYNHTYPQVGTYSVIFKLKDNEGNELIKTISILVKCSTTTPSTLSINPSAVTAANSSVLGFFSYSASGAVSGGKAPYSYAWDFNGDSIIDHQPIDSSYDKWQVWSDNPTSIPVHNLYSNTRYILLTVKDACNFTKTLEKPISFTLPRILAAEFPTPKSYYYVQADVRRTSEVSDKVSINKATNVDLNSIQSQAAPDINLKHHVKCRYSRDKNTNLGRLSIAGLNAYGDHSATMAIHGLEFSVHSIADSGALGVVVNRSSYPVDRGAYSIAHSAEVMSSYIFEMASSCTMEIKVERKESLEVCESAPSIRKKIGIFTGSGSCAGFGNEYAGTVSANQIKFYCEQFEDNICPPADGGGGDDPIGY